VQIAHRAAEQQVLDGGLRAASALQHLDDRVLAAGHGLLQNDLLLEPCMNLQKLSVFDNGAHVTARLPGPQCMHINAEWVCWTETNVASQTMLLREDDCSNRSHDFNIRRHAVLRAARPADVPQRADRQPHCRRRRIALQLLPLRLLLWLRRRRLLLRLRRQLRLLSGRRCSICRISIRQRRAVCILPGVNIAAGDIRGLRVAGPLLLGEVAVAGLMYGQTACRLAPLVANRAVERKLPLSPLLLQKSARTFLSCLHRGSGCDATSQSAGCRGALSEQP